MLTRRRILLGFGALVCCIALAFGLVAWRSHVIATQDERNFASAQQLAKERQFVAALGMIRSGSRAARSADLPMQRWRALEFDTLEQMRNVPRLVQLYEKSPESFDRHETASLLVARAQLYDNDKEAFDRLCKTWRGRTSHPQSWFCLEADALLHEGKIDEAKKLLESRSFEGAADCGRLARLALLAARSDLPGAWDLLDRAYQLDSRNTDIRSFRAQILEGIGRYDAARVEYVAAYLADPDNPVLCDQLAEFYRRRGNYALTQQTWASGLKPPSLDLIWLKALFWSRMAQPIDADLSIAGIPPGDLEPLVRHLLELPPKEYWDAGKFSAFWEGRHYLVERQETFWLRLAQALGSGQEREALRLLERNRFRLRSWNPALEDALACILAYRQGTIPDWVRQRMDNLATGDGNQPPLYTDLAGWGARWRREGPDCKPPEQLKALLKSDEAFAAAFLAGGWAEAALFLHRMDTLPKQFPDWVAYGLTQALRFNRGNRAALDFAARQVARPSLDLLIGELEIATKNVKSGLARLESLAGQDTDVGFRAAWLAALAHIEARRFDRAEQLVQGNARLAQSVTGKEILARLALLQDDVDEARRRYQQLGQQSSEAMAYLARDAFARKNWDEARRLTRQLIERLPDELQLRANLNAIAAAEREK